jgi:transcriptional regulator with XRE-family HTH domain
MYVKRARYLANKTQRELSREAGVDQGLISRVERAVAPWMRVEALVKLAQPLGRNLPLGYCPHTHPCAWQPAPVPEDEWEGVWMPDELREVFRREADAAAAEAHASALARRRR